MCFLLFKLRKKARRIELKLHKLSYARVSGEIWSESSDKWVKLRLRRGFRYSSTLPVSHLLSESKRLDIYRAQKSLFLNYMYSVEECFLPPKQLYNQWLWCTLRKLVEYNHNTWFCLLGVFAAAFDCGQEWVITKGISPPADGSESGTKKVEIVG